MVWQYWLAGAAQPIPQPWDICGQIQTGGPDRRFHDMIRIGKGGNLAGCSRCIDSVNQEGLGLSRPF